MGDNGSVLNQMMSSVNSVNFSQCQISFSGDFEYQGVTTSNVVTYNIIEAPGNFTAAGASYITNYVKIDFAGGIPGDFIDSRSYTVNLIISGAQGNVGARGTSENLADSDLTLQANRIVDFDGNDLKFNLENGEFAIGASGVGKTFHVGRTSDATDVQINGISYPTADGSANQLIKTDGAGQLAFTDPLSYGGTYSWSGYSTDTSFSGSVLALTLPTQAQSSSSHSMIGPSVSQGDRLEGTYGSQNTMVLSNLNSGDTVSYSVTVKITTNNTTIVQTNSSNSGQFATAFSIVMAAQTEQTVTLTGTSTVTNSGASDKWSLRVSLAGSGSGNARVSDFSLTVS